MTTASYLPPCSRKLAPRQSRMVVLPAVMAPVPVPSYPRPTELSADGGCARDNSSLFPSQIIFISQACQYSKLMR